VFPEELPPHDIYLECGGDKELISY
jgi:hypothetical protein